MKIATAPNSANRALGAALHELHEISRGVHPATLSEGGSRPALKSLARRSAFPWELDMGEISDLPEPVEVSAYYVVSCGSDPRAELPLVRSSSTSSRPWLPRVLWHVSTIARTSGGAFAASD